MSNNFFKPAGDLEYSDSYLKPAGDLAADKKIQSLDKEEIEDYLLTVVSCEKYPLESEMGTVCESGRIIVSFSELQRMVDEGYNIISAKCLNKDMIDIDFQKFRKNDNRERGRF